MSKVLLWIFLFLLGVTNIAFTKKDAIGRLLNNVLGAQTQQNSKANTQVARVKDDYAFWQQVVKDHPDYRDGFFRLAIISYQLGYIEETKTYLEKVRQLDPTFAGIVKIEALLTEP